MVEQLGALVLKFPELPEIADEVRFAVLAMLADTQTSPRTPEFWFKILNQDKLKYGPLVRSGLLAVNPMTAITILPEFIDSPQIGEAVALKLDLAWDTLPSSQRFYFVDEVKTALAQCGPSFAGPILEWISTKQTLNIETHPILKVALERFMGQDATPRGFNSKLCPELAA